MSFKKSLLVVLLLLSPLMARGVAGEKNSTACFSVGELGEKWEFGSDHLPTGVSVDNRHFVSWNILDKKYLRWIETNSQGLLKSAIMRDNVPLSETSPLTVREEKIIRQIVEMATHPTHPRSVIALQETNPDVFEELQQRLPKSYVYADLSSSHGDVFFFDNAAFEMVDFTGNNYYDSKNTWSILTLRDLDDGKVYAFVQSHVPGGDYSANARNQLAYQTLTHLNPGAITFIMGDQNRSPDYFAGDLERVAKELNWNANPFQILEIPYPTHVNTLQEASWIDNLFVAGPVYQAESICVSESGEELFAELDSPISVLWEAFPLDETTSLPQVERIQALYHELLDQWKVHYLNQEGNFDLEGIIRAVSYAADKHDGQVRKDAARTPYIIHPLQVCRNLWEIGSVRNSNTLIAAILHDTLEDTDATEEEISTLFNTRIMQIVQEVTNDPALNSEENKQLQVDHAPYMSQDARLVKLSDRLANITDLRTPPPAWSEEKVEGYHEWGRKLLHALRGTNSALEKALEEEIASHYN